ncbi:MAG: LCP family protein [Anaerolineae bacterium]|nr:LCP family protein [Anaerolineae bacterium]
MARDSRRPLEAALIALTSMALALGVAWAPQTPAAAVLEQRPAATPGGPRAGPTGIPVPAGFPTPIPAAPTPLPTADPRKALTAEKLNQDIKIEAGDAPLIKQAAGTINVLLMGIDITLDRRLARTDTVMVASINPEVPSVSLLSIPRDLQVRIPGRSEDRINTVSEYGYLSDYPGGGPSFLAAVLRQKLRDQDRSLCPHRPERVHEGHRCAGRDRCAGRVRDQGYVFYGERPGWKDHQRCSARPGQDERRPGEFLRPIALQHNRF